MAQRSGTSSPSTTQSTGLPHEQFSTTNNSHSPGPIKLKLKLGSSSHNNHNTSSSNNDNVPTAASSPATGTAHSEMAGSDFDTTMVVAGGDDDDDDDGETGYGDEDESMSRTEETANVQDESAATDHGHDGLNALVAAAGLDHPQTDDVPVTKSNKDDHSTSHTQPKRKGTTTKKDSNNATYIGPGKAWRKGLKGARPTQGFTMPKPGQVLSPGNRNFPVGQVPKTATTFLPPLPPDIKSPPVRKWRKNSRQIVGVSGVPLFIPTWSGDSSSSYSEYLAAKQEEPETQATGNDEDSSVSTQTQAPPTSAPTPVATTASSTSKSAPSRGRHPKSNNSPRPPSNLSRSFVPSSPPAEETATETPIPKKIKLTAKSKV